LRQEAWLGAVPKDFTLPRREWIARHKGEARLAEYNVQVGPLKWLVDLMHDAGSVGVEFGMGAAYRGLNWSEIVAWVEGAQMQDVAPFWRRQIMRLSAVYADEMNMASEGEAPYEPD